jgi:hypothetical protein
VALMKLDDDDALVGAKVLRSKDDKVTFENEKGTTFEVGLRKYSVVSRAGKGHALFKRGRLTAKVYEEPTVPVLGEPAKAPRAPKSE